MNEILLVKPNFIFIKIIISLDLIICSTLTECPKELPILKNNNCFSIYCSEEQFSSEECVINNNIIKTKWLNHIIKFENTNGDLFLDSSYDSYKVVFSTTLSNNKDRIFYARDNEQKFFFRNYDGENKSFIIKNIGTSENKEMTNGQLFLIIQSDNYIILIGNENSDIEILNLDLYQNDYDFIPQSTFLKGNRIIKGITSYCKVLDSYDLYCAIITASEDDPLNSYLSFYRQNLNSEDGKLEINYNYLLQYDNNKWHYNNVLLRSL